MARVSFITTGMIYHMIYASGCFGQLFRSHIKRRQHTCTKMEIRLCFVTGLKTRTLMSLVRYYAIVTLTVLVATEITILNRQTTHHTLRYKTILVCEPEDSR